MQLMDQYDLHEIIPELLRFRLNLDIAGFVRAAVRDGLKRDEILGSLHIITNTPDATEKMPLFAVVAQEKDLNRNEILVWLHVSYGGSMGSGVSQPEPADVAARCGGGTHDTGGEGDYQGWEVRGLNWDLWEWRGF